MGFQQKHIPGAIQIENSFLINDTELEIEIRRGILNVSLFYEYPYFFIFIKVF